MKIIIDITKDIDFSDKEKIKKVIDKEDFNDKLKMIVDTGKGIYAHNADGRWIYTISIEKDEEK